MAILKCKMCGGDIKLSPDMTYGICEYCGCAMTLPKIKDSQRAAAFNRGNNFRRAGDFDKALSVYERIVAEDENDAEAHWCCALCRFGIEYVEDPTTYEWLPTCHRASFDSFLEDADYLAALEHSDGITKRQYQRDAAKIAETQRGILATSQNEKPFDVFICYKELGENGERTKDSTLAQEIYYYLTEQGRRVFFARITLEDKAGTKYEPYIFAALNSAKVMIALGTCPENFGSVWVKNEWSRFLSLMKRDRTKLLIPCYQGMDPYDLPEALSVLQSHDMAKIGFLQDLVRGVNKVLNAGEKQQPAKETEVVRGDGGNAGALLKRGYYALEDGDWQKADSFFEQVLNLDAENASAYVGKLCAENKCHREENLVNCLQPFANSSNFRKAIRFGDNSLKVRLEDYNTTIIDRNEENRKAAMFSDAEAKMQSAKTEDEYRTAAEQFRKIPGYNGADANADKCDAFAEETRRQVESKNKAAAQKAQRIIKGTIKSVSVLLLAIIITFFTMRVVIPCVKYHNAVSLFDAGDNDAAIAMYVKSGFYHENIDIQNAWMTECAEAVSAGLWVTVGLAETGSVKTVGYEDNDLCYVGYWTNIMAVSAGNTYVVGLKQDGTVVSAGTNNYGQCNVDAWTDIVAVSTNAFNTIGLKTDGTVIATGDNQFGQCDITGWSDIVAVSAGYSHTVGLRADGFVVATGNYDCSRCDTADWTNITAVSAGDNFTVGLKTDGTVVAVGHNYFGQCNVLTWSDVVAIAAGNRHTIGLKSDGTVVATGDNNYGQCDVSDWTDIVAVSAGSGYSVGLKSDGTVVAVGYNKNGQCDVSRWTDIRVYE